MAQYSKDQLRSIFQNRFNQEAWKSIVVNIFGAGQVRRENELFTASDDPETGYFLGSIDTPDNYRIGLFYYKISSGSVAHKKVGFRNLLKKWINPNWGEFEAAIVVFDDGEEWRLSFICDIKEEATAPKRFTYVFGEKDNFYKTPVDRFEELQKQQPTFENIRKTFSVDALSDDFFDDYRELYADFVEYITGKRYVKAGSKWEEKTITRPNHQFITTFESNDKLVRDYIKKMFGRIVFLYFLQRKGWLNGNRHYMHDLFYNSDKKDDFLDGVLEPLFFEVLNEEKSNRTKDAKSLSGCDNIPYLNGGLFARDVIDERTCVFPAEYFKRLFDFLDSYNFTIDENDTDDAEIGIDPEMLGRIFENLLEDNKDKGAFYTPKEIVDYMCRESLIAYLIGGLPEIKDAKIRLLVEKLDTTDLSDKDKLEIRKTLQKVKICDPAIGSGAFPMGLVNLLSKIYVAMKSDTDTAKMKRHIMEQNIYGVDIEKGAVDIARLRFWLAMIVEEKEPIPLPNLHFKIMQGNSLLESYNGIDLSDLTKVNAQKGLWDSENFERENLIEALRKYYKTTDHTKRDQLFNEIINNVRRQLLAKGVTLPNGEDPSANKDFFLWHTWFSDVFANGGFDIVIGNPPYNELRDLDVKSQNNNKLSKYFQYAKGGRINMFQFFYPLALDILNIEGYCSLITQNSLLAEESAFKNRDLIFKTCKILKIDSFPERDDVNKRVFKSAKMSVCIGLIKKITIAESSITPYSFHVNIWKSKEMAEGFFLKINNEEIRDIYPNDLIIPICDNKRWNLLIKIKKQGNFSINAQAGEIDMTKYRIYFSSDISGMRVLTGAQVQRYHLTDNPSQGQILYLNPSILSLSKERELAIANYRIVMQRITGVDSKIRLISTLVNPNMLCANSTNYISPIKNNFDLYGLLGLLNSKLFNFYIKQTSTNTNVTGKELAGFPIKSLENYSMLFISLVKNILESTPKNDTHKFENEIDYIVYHLYDLTYDEVLIIDPETPFSREEYENFRIEQDNI